MADAFSTSCRACARLANFLDEVRAEHPDYYAKPVPVFGDKSPRLLIVGLAPGMHGANRTGRPFTGDHAGIILYQTLYKFGFATMPASTSVDDGLQLKGCRITNAVKCLPPQNKPLPAEIKQCNRYLAQELLELKSDSAVLALGSIAHQAVLMALNIKKKDFAFAHGARHHLNAGLVSNITLFDSYHCSRYNTQTKRLTTEMFEQVFADIRTYLTEN